MAHVSCFRGFGRRRAAILVVALLTISIVSAAETDVSLTRRPDKSYEVSGLFPVKASTAAVWAVLTDYERIPTFVSSMRSSRVRENRGDGSLLIEQKATGEMFFLSRTMRILLEVRRSSDTLHFMDVGREDFWIYEGEWKVLESTSGVDVSYHLLAQPDFIAPSIFMTRAMKRGVRDLLDQVRAEIIRRERAR
jgi:hypothetical protein